ncbi:MAG: S41 family peptidase [Bacteroidota bacterium]
MLKKNRILKAGIVLLIGGTVALFSFRSADDSYFEVSRNIDIFTTLFRELNIYYVDQTDPAELVRRGIDSMLAGLDPYTQYIPESELEDYRYLTTGQYGGIGALIGQREEGVIITDPYEGYPAQKAGIVAGDRILEIDGKSVKGKNYDDVSRMLKGTPNSVVNVKVERQGEPAPINKSIRREEIKIKNVPYFGIVENNIAYIRLTGFTEDAGQEVKNAVEDLRKKNTLKGIILDLRSNPGGLLNEAVNVVNVFVDKGQEVVSTKGKVTELNKTYKTLNSSVDANTPMAVLVNSGSASAAEIVSGSLQDLDRAIIIGQRTFGKGLVQSTRPLAYNAQLKITTSKYYIPSGRCIQALDYTHRNADGSVGKVPDSLMNAFKTKKGRVVYDGGGIAPDFTMEIPEYSPISTSLITKYLLFDFATDFHLKNSTIADARNFSISDAQYTSFKSWLSSKEYDYITESERKLDELKVQAEKEKYYDAIAPQYELVKQKLAHDKTQDLSIHKDEITEFLENEIVSRYYYQNGRVENGFRHDPEIKMAVKALSDPAVHAAVMARTYKP